MEQLLAQALLLPADQRLVLIEKLAISLHSRKQSEISREYLNEIAEYAKTNETWYSWEQVQEELESDEKDWLEKQNA